MIMKVLFVASEMTPIAKVGGLGDVIGSLPKALRKIGVDARVVLPFYEQIKKLRNLEIEKLISYGIGNEKINVYRAITRDSSVPVYLIENKKYLSRGPIYFGRTAFVSSVTEVERFEFFSEAVLGLLKQPEFWRSDIIHCHDWHTGILIAMAERRPQGARTVFTIHNLANQGIWRGKNLIAEGIKNADLVTTVSPTYAKEILTKEYGEGLEKVLQKRAKEKRLVGILNGIDYDFWSKKHTRLDKIPTFGLVSRLTYQKGIDLVTLLVGEFVKKYKAQFRFLGQGELKNEKMLADLAKRYPNNFYAKIGFDEKLAHKIYRESDFFLMPSRFEPSGLGQMIAMHYGTIPIVRATGGLKDSVRDGKTGLVFEKASSADLKKAMIRAIKIFSQPKKLVAMRKNCRKQDFSWDKSARKYKELYIKTIK